MQQSGLDKVVMMLANSLMKVALVTTHLPLRAVADAISHEEVAKPSILSFMIVSKNLVSLTQKYWSVDSILMPGKAAI